MGILVFPRVVTLIIVVNVVAKVLISTLSVDSIACKVQPMVYDVIYIEEDEVKDVQPLDDSLVGILNGLDMNLV